MPGQIADPAAGGMLLPSIDLDRVAGDDVGPLAATLTGRPVGTTFGMR